MMNFRTSIACACFVATAASPIIYGETVLTEKEISEAELVQSRGPYIVKHDLVIPAGKQLTIREGCVFLFAPYTGIQAEGTLIVDGTPEKPVIFTSLNDSTHNPQSVTLANPFDWNGIFIGAQARNVSIRNFHLNFSVYGIKSLTPFLNIENGSFRQNGQFHFTLNDKIQFVQDNIAFSYRNINASEAPEKVDKKATFRKDPEQRTPMRTQPVLRNGLLGIGVAGALVGTIFGISSAQAYDRVEQLGTGPYLPGEYEKRNDDYTSKSTAAIAGGILGGLGLIGFGLTFAF